MVYTSHYDSPIGALLLAERDRKLVGVWMEGQKYFLGSLRPACGWTAILRGSGPPSANCPSRP